MTILEFSTIKGVVANKEDAIRAMISPYISLTKKYIETVPISIKKIMHNRAENTEIPNIA